MEKREDEKSPRRRDDGSPAALSLVTCCLFPHLTSDDRHLYRALAARLGTRVDEAGTRPAARQKRPKRKDPKRPSGPTTAGDAGAEERDGRERAGPVRIVQWTDSSVEWDSMRLCVIRSPWDYMQRQDEWFAWLESVVRPAHASTLAASSSSRSHASSHSTVQGERGGRPLFLPDYATLLWNSHKRYLLDLDRRGIPIVPTRLLDRGQNFEKIQEELARRNEWGCEFCVVKPAVGSFGNDVVQVKLSASDNTKVMKRLNQMLGEQDLLVQPFLASVKTKGEVSLIFIDNEFVHAVRKKPAQGEFKVQGGKIEQHVATPEEVELARATLRASLEAIYTPHQHSSFCKPCDGAKRVSISAREQASARKDADRDRRLLFARVDLLRENRGALVVSEVEVLDPELFLRLSEACVERLASAIIRRFIARSPPAS